MLDTLVLLLPLAGGYAFSTIFVASRFHSARESDHRLYFRAIFYAVFLELGAIAIHVTCIYWFEWYSTALQFTAGFVSNDASYDGEASLWSSESFLLISLIAFLLGPLLGHFINRFPWLRMAALRSAIRPDDFEQLVFRSLENQMPMLITLRTNKVYLGWAVAAPNPAAPRRFLRVLPLASGFRSEDTQELRFTTSYSEILSRIRDQAEPKPDADIDHLEVTDLEVVIPLDQIASSHLFDVTVYERFYSDVPVFEGESVTARVRIDLRAFTSVELYLGPDLPEARIWLLIANLTGQDLWIDRINYEATFGGPVVIGSMLEPLSVAEGMVKENVLIRAPLNEIQRAALRKWVDADDRSAQMSLRLSPVIRLRGEDVTMTVDLHLPKTQIHTIK